MDRIARLEKNAKLLFWSRLFTGLKAMNAIATLFYLHRGVTIDQIFFLSIAWSVTSLVFEVPTGYLADRFGRKNTLLLGMAIWILSDVAAFFAHGFPAFIGVFVLMSLAYACASGTEEALLYDSLKELGHENKMTTQNGKLYASSQVMQIFIPSLGALIAVNLLEWQFQMLILIDAVSAFTAVVFLSRLIEPRHARDVAEAEKGIFRQSLETLTHEPFLLRASLNKLLIFIASFLLWRVYQPYFQSHGLGVMWLSLFYFLLNGVIVPVQWNIGKLEKRIGSFRILFGTSALCFLLFVVLVFLQNAYAIFFTCLLLLLFANVREPVFAHAVNQRVRSHSRATTLSNLNVIKSLLDIPLLLLTGWLAAMDPRFVFVVGALLCLMVMAFFTIQEKDVNAIATSEQPS